MVTVNIFGSCVTRDAIEYDDSESIKLLVYIARQSVISAVSKPINLQQNDIRLDSEFQRRQVYYDLAKKAFEVFENSKSDLLLIDFIDERLELIKYKGSICTKSSYLTDSKYLEKTKHVPYQYDGIKTFRVNGFKVEKYMRKFLKRITKIYEPRRIIIHRAKMLNEYIDINGDIHKFSEGQIRKNQIINRKLEYLYDLAESNLPGCFTIDISQEFNADEGQKWGLAPMHYEEDYYKKLMTEIVNYSKSLQ